MRVGVHARLREDHEVDRIVHLRAGEVAVREVAVVDLGVGEIAVVVVALHDRDAHRAVGMRRGAGEVGADRYRHHDRHPGPDAHP